jgi:glycosyltransferase involved in cell wall biosynthesis
VLLSERSESEHAARALRVLHVVGNAIVGGMETYVRQLVETLDPNRIRTTVLLPFESEFAEALRRAGAEVHVTPIYDEVGWPSLQYACGLVEEGAIDVIQTHLPNAHALGGLAGRLMQRPVLATVHGRALVPLDLEAHRRTGTHLGVVCRAAYFHALAMGAERARLHRLSFGVDTARFSPSTARGALRHGLGFDARTPLVGFVGRLSWEKGPDLFVQIARVVRASCPQTRFVVVGEGPMRPELVALARASGLGTSLAFVGQRDDMPQVLADLDVVVSSSRAEATPFAIMEAMASGVPVAAFKAGGVAEMIRHGANGWLANEHDIDGLAAIVTRLVMEPALREAASAAARLHAVESLDARAHAQTLAGLLERLGGRAPAAANTTTIRLVREPGA